MLMIDLCIHYLWIRLHNRLINIRQDIPLSTGIDRGVEYQHSVWFPIGKIIDLSELLISCQELLL